ncbi:MAG: hypothetical protein JW757_06860 [Anaerolineales bacterium]|nr:hypothetical protein [Anaerolineales bacterium]
MHNKILYTLLAVSLLALILAAPALAQEEAPELEIDLNRDFGYGGFGNQIQGNFSIRVSGPDDLAEVQFYLDEILLGTDQEAPFRLQFVTDDYAPGIHQIYAVGTLAEGTQLRSREITADFLSAESAGEKTMELLVPILGFTVLAMVIAALVPMLTGKKGGKVTLGNYGLAGGAVCPRCTFPFKRHYLSPNMLVGKLVRCPHCGKWAILPAASSNALSAAEERYLASQVESSEVELRPETSLKSALDDSRFED